MQTVIYFKSPQLSKNDPHHARRTCILTTDSLWSVAAYRRNVLGVEGVGSEIFDEEEEEE